MGKITEKGIIQDFFQKQKNSEKIMLFRNFPKLKKKIGKIEKLSKKCPKKSEKVAEEDIYKIKVFQINIDLINSDSDYIQNNNCKILVNLPF